MRYGGTYIKTLYGENLGGNQNYVVTLCPEDDLLKYLYDLIMDMSRKRDLSQEKILLVVESAWLEQALHAAFTPKLMNNFGHLPISEDQIHICHLDSALRIFESDYPEKYAVCIALNFLYVHDDRNALLENFKTLNPDVLLIGIDDGSSMNPLQSMQTLLQEVKFIDREPDSFERFINLHVWMPFEELLSHFEYHHLVMEFKDKLYGSLNDLESHETFTINIGTPGLLESDSSTVKPDSSEVKSISKDDDEAEDMNEIPEFLLTVTFSKFTFSLDIQVQDYRWDDTFYFSYFFDFEEEIVDKVSSNYAQLDDVVETIIERARQYSNYVSFSDKD